MFGGKKDKVARKQDLWSCRLVAVTYVQTIHGFCYCLTEQWLSAPEVALPRAVLCGMLTLNTCLWCEKARSLGG
jgi:uncharacterized MnhB-related membrane protein